MTAPRDSVLYRIGGFYDAEPLSHRDIVAGATVPNYVALAVRSQDILRRGPIQARDLAAQLGIGRRTAERILASLALSASDPLRREQRGREVWYSLDPKGTR